MAVFADLCAAPDGAPSVDHCAFADISTDIDETGHQHTASANKRAFAGNGARNNPETGVFEPRLVPSGKFAWHFVICGMARAAAFDQSVIIEAKGQQDRFFQPLIDCPAALSIRLSHAALAAIQHGQRCLDIRADLCALRSDAVARLPCGFYAVG